MSLYNVEVCFLNNYLIDNLFDNYVFTKKKQISVQKLKQQRDKAKT